MAGALNKVLDFLGMDSHSDEIDEVENEEYGYGYEGVEEEPETKSLFGRKSKVVAMPQSQQVKMVISQPTTFEQAEEIGSYFKERKSVIVNLEYVNKDVARRIVDFMSGSAQALDGSLQKVSNSIFLLAPANYEVANDMGREELKNKISVSWLK
ncbi:MAG: cell division protein SepF [Lachnospiraceae bacterium]|jgi:cell division inhibitor SepF|nr:cell division protein SepF [Lachnospiraceae bacterium]